VQHSLCHEHKSKSFLVATWCVLYILCALQMAASPQQLASLRFCMPWPFVAATNEIENSLVHKYAANLDKVIGSGSLTGLTALEAINMLDLTEPLPRLRHLKFWPPEDLELRADGYAPSLQASCHVALTAGTTPTLRYAHMMPAERTWCTLCNQ